MQSPQALLAGFFFCGFAILYSRILAFFLRMAKPLAGEDVF
jgi:hypothetical protein